MKTLLFLLACYGLTNAIVREYVFYKVRVYLQRFDFLGKLVTCEICTSFWVGMSLFWIMNPISDILALHIVACGLISTGFVKIFLKIISLYEKI